MDASYAAIVEVLAEYFDGLHHSDSARLSRVFHPHAHYVCATEDALVHRTMAEYFPIVDVEVGNELFWYIFKGEPEAKDGFVDLKEDVPGLGLTINEEALKNFEVAG